MYDVIVARGLPAYVLGAPEGDEARDDTPSLLLQVWPTPGAPQRVTPGTWDRLLDEWSGTPRQRRGCIFRSHR